jgi:hypothetical protein
MAMTKCKECNNEISTKADQCPKCGAKQKRSIIWPLIIAFVVIGLLGNLLDPKKAERNTQSADVPQVKTTTFSQGSRNANLDKIISQMSPFFDSYRIEDPIVQMQINASAWTTMSRDQQQFLLDTLATKAIVQEMNNILYLYVLETKVGEIGPGWGGEWKFRRTQ